MYVHTTHWTIINSSIYIRNSVRTYIHKHFNHPSPYSPSTPLCLSLYGLQGKRGKKKTASPSVNGLNWAAEEERVLRLLSCLADLELCQLWDPPSVAIMDSYSKCVSAHINVVTSCSFNLFSSSFHVSSSQSLVASCCYKMLESPSAMKEKAVKEELFQLLGLLVKKYNQTLSELSAPHLDTSVL